MTDRRCILYGDVFDYTKTIDEATSAAYGMVMPLNSRLAEATHACGDIIFDGTVVRIEVYHLRSFEAGSTAAWHRHTFTELSLVAGGPVAFEHDGGEATLQEGEYFLMPAFTPHRWRVLNQSTILHGFMLTVRPAAERADSLVPRLPDAAAHLGFRLPSEPSAEAALRQAEEESRRGDALGVVAAAACIRLALALLFRPIVAAVPSEASPSHPDAPAALPLALERAVDFIVDHMADPLDVAAVARHVHLSRRQLDRLFDATFGVPAGAFLQHTRLQRARYLVGGTDLTIKEIAYACGFTDPNYFGRVFRKRYGASPVAYRRRG